MWILGEYGSNPGGYVPKRHCFKATKSGPKRHRMQALYKPKFHFFKNHFNLYFKNKIQKTSFCSPLFQNLFSSFDHEAVRASLIIGTSEQRARCLGIPKVTPFYLFFYPEHKFRVVSFGSNLKTLRNPQIVLGFQGFQRKTFFFVFFEIFFRT